MCSKTEASPVRTTVTAAAPTQNVCLRISPEISKGDDHKLFSKEVSKCRGKEATRLHPDGGSRRAEI